MKTKTTKLAAVVPLVVALAVPRVEAGHNYLYQNNYWKPEYVTEVMVSEPPDDAGARARAFAERNSPENIQKLAKEFFSIMNAGRIPYPRKPIALDSKGVNERRPEFEGNKTEPDTKVTDLIKEGKWQEALDAYRDYFFGRLASPPPGFQIQPLSPVENDFTQFIHQPDELLKDHVARFTMVDPNGKNAVVRLNMGEPGRVNWLWQPKGFAPHDTETFKYPENYISECSGALNFHKCLLTEYMRTGDKKYLQKWSEYYDDRSMNLHRDLAEAGLLAGREVSPMETHKRIYGNLMFMAQKNPAMAKDFPSATLARVLLETFKFLPTNIRNARATSSNRSIELYSQPLQDFGVSFPEFYASQYALREKRRIMEGYATATMMPDGSDIENAEGYNSAYLHSATHSMEVFNSQSREIPWAGPDWLQELRENLEMRTGYLIRRKGNLGMDWYPNYLDRTRMAGYYAGPTPKNTIYTPGALNDPVLRKIRNTLWEGGDAGAPEFTSEFWPYSGQMVIREGWGKNDQHLYMDSGRPYNSHSWKNANDIQLFAFGQALLSLHSDGYGYNRSGHAGELYEWMTQFQDKIRKKYNNPGQRGMYQWEFTPLFVDGLPQMGHEAFDSSSLEYRTSHHGVYGKNNNLDYGTPEADQWVYGKNNNMAYQTPLKHRWHESERFNVAEGVFKGSFAALDGSKIIDGVAHQRQLVFLRGVGLWIVVDRASSPDEHTYKLDWKPAQPFESAAGDVKWAGFRSHQVTGSDADKSVKTSNPDTPNISIYMHSPAELKMYQYGAEFQGKGPQVVVSALFPRKTIQDELKSIETLPGKDGVSGFKAVTPDGSAVWCQAAEDPAKGGSLQAGPVGAKGEALVVVKRADGTCYGVALGCKELSVEGKKQPLDGEDLEFRLEGKAIAGVEPIRRPMDRVEIFPAADRFVESVEVGMKHNEPDTEIRYTLDGTNPTLSSPLYEKPLVLKGTTMVKAAAFRKGLKKMPQANSSTEVSVPLRAYYEKAQPLANIEDKPVKPGLNYTYYEGDFSLGGQMAGLPEPKHKGGVDSLIELPHRADKKSFAYDYTGFIKIPEDGIYTFHAPWQLITPTQDAGFDLRLWVGKQEWYPTTRWHNFGGWSIPLKKGLYPLRAFYVDQRGSNMWAYKEGQAVWPGDKPRLLVSGPGMDRQPIPADWLGR